MFTRTGGRKYLTRNERDAFLKHARLGDVETMTFCYVLAYTGCRISEALQLRAGSIDFSEGQVVIHSLKKRGRQVFRGVPLPPDVLAILKEGMRTGALGRDRLWPWSRITGYRRVCAVMSAAGIRGTYATPRGLRHGFGVCAVQSHVPLNMVQRWLGHADIKTTAIYTNAMGPEEREIAARMWRHALS
ncbi:tyrosine-type recombinase/integrase [Novosphingobium sp. JCM 18896]|uniref:tyrosine-type recombinase/integrase n=1 Tax=Novosphingobium sp. JCM 18896 TaxID=2989731 RepID=UPI0022236F52|nr:tyrosine-type recombinase/integrase [Novosphingobium sp. JCM 18896]MCW1430811.1 tyrosine-type recombinase/integrase [Novosphingobium sp. JCM 18896]